MIVRCPSRPGVIITRSSPPPTRQNRRRAGGAPRGEDSSPLPDGARWAALRDGAAQPPRAELGAKKVHPCSRDAESRAAGGAPRRAAPVATAPEAATGLLATPSLAWVMRAAVKVWWGIRWAPRCPSPSASRKLISSRNTMCAPRPTHTVGNEDDSSRSLGTACQQRYSRRQRTEAVRLETWLAVEKPAPEPAGDRRRCEAEVGENELRGCSVWI